MKSNLVWQIGVVALAAVAVIGCATGGKGPTDEELVQGLLESWKGAIIEKNLDMMMATFAEDFAHDGYEYEAADKAALREFIDNCDGQGYFDGVDISFEGSATTIEDDTATVADIAYANDQGSVVVELNLKKVKGAWLISDMHIEGL